MATFAFTNTNAVNSMYLAKLSSDYVDLKNVTIGVASAADSVVSSALVIDDLKHCNSP